jgi:hypothetical protein
MLWSHLLVEKMTGAEHVIFDGTPRSLQEAQILDPAITFYNRQRLHVLLPRQLLAPSLLPIRPLVLLLARMAASAKRDVLPESHLHTDRKAQECVRWLRMRLCFGLTIRVVSHVIPPTPGIILSVADQTESEGAMMEPNYPYRFVPDKY